MTERHLSPSFQTPGKPNFPIDLAAAIKTISDSIKEDSDYAWSWHCNIAVPFIDEGGSHEQANRAAARFMQIMFDVDVTTFTEWKAFESIWTAHKKIAIPSREEIIDTLNQWRNAETTRDGKELDNARTNRDKLLAQYATA